MGAPCTIERAVQVIPLAQPLESSMLKTLSLSCLLALAAAPAWADIAPDEPQKSEKKDEDEGGCSQIPGGALALPSVLAGAALLLGARRRQG
jgi:hypothetical protein